MTLVGKHNIAKMYSSTTGTGTLTLTTAFALCNTFALAGVVNGETLTVRITDPQAGSEVTRGVYTASGTTFSRDTVLSSTNGGSKINCSGRQTVTIVQAAEDINTLASYYYNSTDSITNNTDDNQLSINTETVDQSGDFTVSSNQAHINRIGWYIMNGAVSISAGAALNGYVGIYNSHNSLIYNTSYATATGITADTLPIHSCLVYVGTAPEDISIKLNNHSGQTLTAAVYELNFHRVGDK